MRPSLFQFSVSVCVLSTCVMSIGAVSNCVADSKSGKITLPNPKPASSKMANPKPANPKPANPKPAAAQLSAKKSTLAQTKEAKIEALLAKSDLAFHGGNYPLAVKCHRDIIAVDPTETESYGLGAWLLFSLNKRDESIHLIRQGLKANPKSADMWEEAGAHFDLLKKFADAKIAFGKAVQLSGKTAPQMLRRRYAHAAEHAGDLRTSRDVWRALNRDYPGQTPNMQNLARLEKVMAQREKVLPT